MFWEWSVTPPTGSVVVILTDIFILRLVETDQGHFEHD
jgi:hypothetical protein